MNDATELVRCRDCGQVIGARLRDGAVLLRRRDGAATLEVGRLVVLCHRYAPGAHRPCGASNTITAGGC